MTSSSHSSSTENLNVVAASAADGAFSQAHLLGISKLAAGDILQILDLADSYADANRGQPQNFETCCGLTLANLFFENSTRTQLSFDLAAQRLGMDVINLATVTSSIAKGETLMDTALTINAMRPDAMVVRHSEAGAVAEISERMSCPVINAGDGTGEHPTQALADALTIRRRKGRLEGLIVAICGDISHSRVARSNLHLLGTLGAHVRLVGPEDLLPDDAPAKTFTNMREGIEGADVVMMLRIQKERMKGTDAPAGDDYFREYGLDREKLAFAKDDAIVMHPGPMNRGVEIASDVADDTERSLILTQVEMGVAVRMACLDLLTRPARNKG